MKKRTRPAIVYVYATPAEKAELEEAAAQLVADVPGAKLALSRFVLQAALEKARAIKRSR